MHRRCGEGVGSMHFSSLVVSTSKPRTTSLPFWASKLASGRSEDKWQHHEVCVEVKQKVIKDVGTVGCTRKELDGFASRVCIHSRGDLVISHGTIY